MYKNKIAAIFFDVGDVLIVDTIDHKYVDLADKYGLDLEALRQTRKKIRPLADLGTISDPEFWQMTLKEMDIEAQPEDWELGSYYEEVPGIREIIMQLKAKNYPLAIITDDSREMAMERRLRFGYNGIFNKVVVSAECGCAKPDERIYRQALQQMDALADASLFIDNLEVNLVGARKVNMQTILFKNAQELIQDLHRMGIL